jgi:flagellar assembly factor FliW
MEVLTSRFGPLEVAPRDVIRFPAGMPGLDQCTNWVLLADAHNEALGWLQSTDQPEVALAVVSPRRFVPEYQLRVSRADLGAELGALSDELQVLAIVSKQEHGITLNLKAPLVVHLASRLGRQVIASGDQPVQYELSREASPRKKIA